MRFVLHRGLDIDVYRGDGFVQVNYESQLKVTLAAIVVAEVEPEIRV